MNVLTASAKKKITSDWHNEFSELGVYKDMWLAKRSGPLVIGICLDRTSGNEGYRPTFHIHNLCRPFPVVTLTLAHRLRAGKHGAEEIIRIKFHENRIQEALKQFRVQAPLPLDGPLRLDDVIRAYESSQKNRDRIERYSITSYEDILLLLGWCERFEEIESRIELFQDKIGRWPREIRARIGGIPEWKFRMLNAAHDVSGMRDTVMQEVVRHKLENLPTYKLAC